MEHAYYYGVTLSLTSALIAINIELKDLALSLSQERVVSEVSGFVNATNSRNIKTRNTSNNTFFTPWEERTHFSSIF
jgi:hypothetical protein